MDKFQGQKSVAIHHHGEQWYEAPWGWLLTGAQPLERGDQASPMPLDRGGYLAWPVALPTQWRRRSKSTGCAELVAAANEEFVNHAYMLFGTNINILDRISK